MFPPVKLEQEQRDKELLNSSSEGDAEAAMIESVFKYKWMKPSSSRC